LPLPVLQAAGLFSTPKGNLRTYIHRLLLPFWLDGEVLGLYARNIDWTGKEDGAKELCIASPLLPFHADLLLGSPDQVHVTEGMVDCLSLMELGLPAVGVPGATSVKKAWVPLFDEVPEIVVAFGADEEGQRGAAQIVSWFAAAGRKDLKQMRLPPGINDLLLSGHLRSGTEEG
jgi:hypothetical protein